nr:transducin-like enhancer protein 3-B [Oncorhynchus nerka]
MPPHPSGLQPPGIPPIPGVAGSGLLALGALGSQAHLPSVKDEKNNHDLEHRGLSSFHSPLAIPLVKERESSTVSSPLFF